MFFLSGRTKIEGLFTITDSAYEPVRIEYRLPLIPPAIACLMATVSEHVFSILLILGLFTRVSAAALLAMGGGRLSLDAPIFRRGC